MVGLKAKSKVSRVLVLLTVARRKRSASCFWAAALDFVFQEPGQELDVGPVAVHGLAVTGFQGLQNAGQPQLGQVRGELVSQFHAAPPNRWPSNSAALRAKVRAGGAGTATAGAGSTSRPLTRMRLIVT